MGKKAGAATLERQVEGPTETEKDQVMDVVSIKPSIIGGEDVLGGRNLDCPDEFHKEMVALAQRGEIPITKPMQRENYSRRRPTFHGSPQWRQASMMGYIHPDIPAPTGTKWKKVAFGWKLVDETTAAEQYEAPSSRPKAYSSEPLGSMTLHAILQAACPDWSDKEIMVVRKKLGKIRIENTMTLLEA